MIDARSVLPFAAAVVWVAAATALALLLQRLPHANLSLVYLIAVLVVAVREGFWPSIFASVLSFLVFNIFFTPPFYTVAVHDEGDIATLVFFLAVAALGGKLAARMRAETNTSRAAVQRTSRLLSFSRRMAGAASVDDALSALAESAAQALHCATLAWTPAAGDARAEIRARAGAQTAVPAADDLQCAWRSSSPAHREGAWLFLPIGTGTRRLGLLGVERENLTSDERELLVGLCDQTAVAVERVLLAGDLDEARVSSETEKFRTALLSSVSHDLRTPLATIIGSITSLQELWPSLAPEARRELLQAVLDESQRLDRQIQNLLDMARLGDGALRLAREWVDLNDVVANAIRRLDTVLGNVRLVVDIAPDAALMHVHGALVEQVVVNLLENAARFSPPGGTVMLTARRRGRDIVVDFVDRGTGIPEADRERIFDMFYSAKGPRRGDEGSGLGLAICRGFIGAHGGEIHALAPSEGGGTCMRVTLPAGEDGESDRRVARSH